MWCSFLWWVAGGRTLVNVLLAQCLLSPSKLLNQLIGSIISYTCWRRTLTLVRPPATHQRKLHHGTHQSTPLPPVVTTWAVSSSPRHHASTKPDPFSGSEESEGAKSSPKERCCLREEEGTKIVSPCLTGRNAAVLPCRHPSKTSNVQRPTPSLIQFHLSERSTGWEGDFYHTAR